MRTCLKSQWTGTLPVCVENHSGCLQPQNIEHGDFSFLGEKDNGDSGLIAENSEVFYSCRTGYRFEDESQAANLVCRGGHWQGMLPRCGTCCGCKNEACISFACSSLEHNRGTLKSDIVSFLLLLLHLEFSSCLLSPTSSLKVCISIQ